MSEEKKKKILLIEDDEVLGPMYKTKLEQDGYEVVLAQNGIDAIKESKNTVSDIVLLDIIMPGLDGFSVLEDLRKNSKYNKVPIVMLTNLGTDEDREKGEKLGANGYLVKANITPSQVTKEIKEILKK